jgi:hypothetical protein
VQLSLESDRAADRDGQQEGGPIQLLELLRDQTQIHNREIGTRAARIELNPALRVRGGSPLWRSPPENVLAIERPAQTATG